MKIGVLALQGDFAEHIAVIRRLGVEAIEVRIPKQLEGLNGLIIPGGESTTIGKLAVDFNMLEPLRQYGKENPVWGTCAGAIFISKDAHHRQPLLELMDITVERNAFGRQVASFEVDVEVPMLEKVQPGGGPFHAIFIRAPLIEAVHGQAQALACLEDGRIVAAQQGHWLATVFHPELTTDDRFHRYFLQLAGYN
ncbi:MAG: pyridoxal 5'-phosphate synthase glutaminase subunit PdxT [Anaerolineaceae bacterium]